MNPRATITRLIITAGNIGELEHLAEYTSLTILDCANNQLTHLPEVLPATLQKLYCYNNPVEHDIYNQSIEEIRQWQLENPRYYEPIFK